MPGLWQAACKARAMARRAAPNDARAPHAQPGGMLLFEWQDQPLEEGQQAAYKVVDSNLNVHLSLVHGKLEKRAQEGEGRRVGGVTGGADDCTCMHLRNTETHAVQSSSRVINAATDWSASTTMSLGLPFSRRQLKHEND
eukprot:3382355-Pleurochrysis_carterae.AAC.1